MDIELKNLVSKIKTKKYMSLSDDLINLEIENYLKNNIRASEKEIIKAVKARLHKIYGSFQIKKRNKEKTILKIQKKPLKQTFQPKKE